MMLGLFFFFAVVIYTENAGNKVYSVLGQMVARRS